MVILLNKKYIYSLEKQGYHIVYAICCQTRFYSTITVLDTAS